MYVVCMYLGVSVAGVGFRTKKPKKSRWGELNPGLKSGSPGQIPLCYCALVVPKVVRERLFQKSVDLKWFASDCSKKSLDLRSMVEFKTCRSKMISSSR